MLHPISNVIASVSEAISTLGLESNINSKKERYKIMKLKIYIFLGGISATLLFFIARLNEMYSLSGGLNCLYPIIGGILVALYGIVMWFVRRYK